MEDAVIPMTPQEEQDKWLAGTRNPHSHVNSQAYNYDATLELSVLDERDSLRVTRPRQKCAKVRDDDDDNNDDDDDTALADL